MSTPQPARTQYFYDTEFLEDGHTIALISIGIVSATGREYYAVNADMPVDRIDAEPWLMAHVWPSLPLRGGALDHSAPEVKPPAVIRDDIHRFLLAERTPELWAYFSAYDHVALCQLWGRMIDLPRAIPMYTHDLRSHMDLHPGFTKPIQASGQHNALEDARHNRDVYNAMSRYAVAQVSA